MLLFHWKKKTSCINLILWKAVHASALEQLLTSGWRVEGVEETAKVRPLKSTERTLTMDRASSGAATLTDSFWKSMLFPISSVRLRTLHWLKDRLKPTASWKTSGSNGVCWDWTPLPPRPSPVPPTCQPLGPHLCRTAGCLRRWPRCRRQQEAPPGWRPPPRWASPPPTPAPSRPAPRCCSN